MKDLKEAKVGDLMFDVEADTFTEVVDISVNRILTKDIGAFDVTTYDSKGRLINDSGEPDSRTLFYKGQITENEYLGLSADGVKMFYGMKAFSFHLASENRDITEFISRDCDKLKEHNVYSAAYSTKEAAEKAQKEHFEPETFPLPWWLTVLELDKHPSVRVGNLPFRFSAYSNGWGKVPTDIADVVPAHFVKAQFSELKNGDFFNLGADLNHILLKVHEGNYVRITNEGEVRNQNLGKLSEAFKVVASEVEKEVDTDGLVEVGALKNGDMFRHKGSEYVFSYNHEGDTVCNELINNEWIEVVFYSKTRVTKINKPERQKVAIGTLSVGEFFTLNPSGDVFMIDRRNDYAVGYICIGKHNDVICYELDKLVYKIQKR